MIADFAEVYGLRLTDVVDNWSPAEAIALIAGLSKTRSRYAAKVQGHEQGMSWTDRDYLALDARNAVEGLRATVVSALTQKKKDIFREWNDYPGRAVQRAKKVASMLSAYRRLAGDTGNYEVR